MSRFLNEKYALLKQYTPGEQPQNRKYIKLNTNESPYPPSEGVLRVFCCEEADKLRLYSDPEGKALRQALARSFGVLPENILLANGSDEILNFAFMAFGAGGVCYPEISYGFYPVYAALHGISADAVPLESDFTIDAEKFCGRNRFLVLANPNAPTGSFLPVSEIEKIVVSNPNKVVLIDEAYVDFGGESCIPLTKKYNNLLVVQTYSKSRSMAGARLGFAVADAALIADLDRLRCSTNPYNVNRMTLLAGEKALEEQAYYDANCRRIIATREKTVAALQKAGFEVLPSKANFIFVKSAWISGEELYRTLKERGILIRHFSDPKISDYNRVTIGSEEEMQIFLETVKTISEEKNNAKK